MKTHTSTNETWSPTPEDMAAYDARDKRVRAAVLAAIEENLEEAARFAEEAKACRVRARELRDACAKEEWWKLAGVVSKEDRESLCDVSPSGLLDDAE